MPEKYTENEKKKDEIFDQILSKKLLEEDKQNILNEENEFCGFTSLGANKTKLLPKDDILKKYINLFAKDDEDNEF